MNLTSSSAIQQKFNIQKSKIMRIVLNTLVINNFKGIKELSINFDPYNTGIYAANEVGKTTVSDAWHWLLTGKNSADQKDFNIKNTVDTSLNRGDHEVTALLTVNGVDLTLRKVYREKWQKKRGTEIPEYTGNETVYYFNEVPVQQYDYQAKINGMLDENVLKMITNPLYFNSNSTTWGWKQRREVLLTIAGNISDEEIFAQITTPENRAQVADLIDKLRVHKKTSDYKDMIREQKRKRKNELEMIPPRIAEATHNKPEVLDWSQIEKEIAAKQADINKIDSAIADSNTAFQAQNNAALEHQKETNLLAQRKASIVNEVSMSVNNQLSQRRLQRQELANKVTETERALQFGLNNVKEFSTLITATKAEMDRLRENWSTINSRELRFDESQFECPACKRAFESGDIASKKEELTTNFNTDKQKQLDSINDTGVKRKTYLAQLEGDLEGAQLKLTTLESDASAVKAALSEFDAVPEQKQDLETVLAANDDYIQVKADIAALAQKAPEINRPDHSVFTLQKNQLSIELDALKKQLNTREQIAQADKRIAELQAEEKSLSQQVADLERIEFLIESFDKTKMDIMEQRVNGKFNDVTFKLFDRQVNGGETPTCETMYKGVPFSDLNTAHRIWAGICIINTLSEFYGVTAPIFLDNRESVTNIPETSAQVINLIVSPEDKQIRVVTDDKQLAVA
jgi:chromosome segregation ATPase